MSRAAHRNESCRTNECVMAYIYEFVRPLEGRLTL